MHGIKEYNALQNAKENMNDSWFAWLGNLGFVGHMADRWRVSNAFMRLCLGQLRKIQRGSILARRPIISRTGVLRRIDEWNFAAAESEKI